MPNSQIYLERSGFSISYSCVKTKIVLIAKKGSDCVCLKTQFSANEVLIRWLKRARDAIIMLWGTLEFAVNDLFFELCRSFQ